MKISGLIELLQEQQKELGDVEVVIYDYRCDNVISVDGVLSILSQYTDPTVLEIY